jgi:hypothetical protein
MFRDNKKMLLKRLGAELEIDEFRGDAYDMLASMYHRERLRRAAKRMIKTRVRYEELMSRDSGEVLRESLKSTGGLDDVVEALGASGRAMLIDALTHVDSVSDLSVVDMRKNADLGIKTDPVSKPQTVPISKPRPML